MTHASAERSLFAALLHAESERQIGEVLEQITSTGFSGFRTIVYDYQDMLKRADEEGIARAERLLAKCARIIPDPGRFSPSWTYIWDDIAAIIAIIKSIHREVPPAERDGYWQVLMNNPFTLDGVICHPGLEFAQAAYLYAYYRKDLKKNEFIKLQKVRDIRTEHGN